MDKFFEYSTKIPPKKGCLLISEPYLGDQNFDRSVILLCEHNEDGAFGFVLTKMSGVSLNQVIDEIDFAKGELLIGGPVQQDTLHFVYNFKENISDSSKIDNELYWGGDFEEVKDHILAGNVNLGNFKFFVGYSGWGEGQLQEEIDSNSWIVTDHFPKKLIFNTKPEDLWRQILIHMGGRFEVYANYPVDPNLN